MIRCSSAHLGAMGSSLPVATSAGGGLASLETRVAEKPPAELHVEWYDVKSDDNRTKNACHVWCFVAFNPCFLGFQIIPSALWAATNQKETKKTKRREKRNCRGIPTRRRHQQEPGQVLHFRGSRQGHCGTFCPSDVFFQKRLWKKHTSKNP